MIKLCAFADEANEMLVGQIEALKRNNISFIELRGVDKKNVLTLTDEEAKKAYELLKTNGISVFSIGSPIGKVELSMDLDKYMETVERACQLANIFHAKNVRMFSFYKAYEDKDRVITYLKKMVEIGNRYGVNMCHENEKDIYGDIEPRVTEILNAVSGLKYVYDPANFIQCHQDPNESLNKLFNRATYFHIKDCLMETGEVVPAGEGDGKLNELVSRIHDDKVLTVEPHLKVFAGYANVDKTQLKNKYTFNSNDEAFDCAVSSIKKILKNNGYKEINGGFVK